MRLNRKFVLILLAVVILATIWQRQPFSTLRDYIAERTYKKASDVYLDSQYDEVKKINIPYSGIRIDKKSENEMVELVNKERGAVGLNKLLISQELIQVARVHGIDMWKRQYFAHINPDGESPFDRLDKYGVEYLSAGENLALAPSVRLAQEGLMQSPSHRDNILGREYKKIGVGAVDGGKKAGIMFVQMFSN